MDTSISGAYKVRICHVFSTPWRQTEGTVERDASSFEHTEKFEEFIAQQQDSPNAIEQQFYPGESLSIDGSEHTFADLARVELVLFALPFPVSQVVATLVLDFHESSFTAADNNRVRSLMQAVGSGRLRLEHRAITTIVDELAQDVRAVHEDRVAGAVDGQSPHVVQDVAALALAPGGSEPDAARLVGLPAGLDRERHTLVFVQPTADADSVSATSSTELEAVARGLIYGVHWPYRPEFTTIYTPEDLAVPGEALAAVSHYASVLYGQADEVHSSVLLSTVQTVGTAARFQWIWRQAYSQVRGFQLSKQAKETGKQTRESLAPLADALGNLELDLTFNVQTAADLGLGSTTALVDSFHQALHEAMKFKARADTVANMFQRVNSSIQSELTAIVSREKQEEDDRRFLEQQNEDDRRFRGALVVGLLTFLLAPLGLIIGYFGINTKEVTKDDSIFFFHHYWFVYALAALLIVAPVATAAIFNPKFLRRQFKLLRRRDNP